MSDSGSIVVGWLGRLVVLFAVLGLLAYDGFTVMVASFGAADDAGVAANAAADSFKAKGDIQLAYDSAVQAVAGKGDTVDTKTFQVDQAGKVSLTIDRTPTTLWMHRVGPLKKWTQIHQTGTGTPPG
ncbi:MAG TPA: hypothetical protein VMZ11_03315 [Mycobacteriales bacterium]|nr:hypothetical protein [Mycobacteriales bacterium]